MLQRPKESRCAGAARSRSLARSHLFRVRATWLEYALVLRLVVISLLIPADTSECERIFSLMNDIKTSERSSMGQQNIKNLMLWHISGHQMNEDDKKEKMPCRNVPVMAILKEFRDMAEGVRGRKAHRAQEVPKYEYEKHRAPIKVEE